MRSRVRREGSGCGNDFCHSGILYSELLFDTLVVFNELVLVIDFCPQCFLNSADPSIFFTHNKNSSKRFKYLFMVGFIRTSENEIVFLSSVAAVQQLHLSFDEGRTTGLVCVWCLCLTTESRAGREEHLDHKCTSTGVQYCTLPLPLTTVLRQKMKHTKHRHVEDSNCGSQRGVETGTKDSPIEHLLAGRRTDGSRMEVGKRSGRFMSCGFT